MDFHRSSVPVLLEFALPSLIPLRGQPMWHSRTGDLVGALERARLPHEVWSVAGAYLHELGITHAIYSYVDPDEPRRTQTWTTLPDDWCAHYLDRAYHLIDPFHAHCCRTFDPVGTGGDYLSDYDYLNDRERRFILEGAETGFRSGFSAPVRLVGRGAFGGWNFGSALPRGEFERAMAEFGDSVRLAGFFIHERLQKAIDSAPQGEGASVLTPRERECLLRLARGLRNERIAEELGLAVVTVDLHMSRARKKLGAATREEALAKAILRGEICP